MNADIERTRAVVAPYRKLGLCPLPSREDVKGPMLPTYAEHYGPTPVPGWVYEKWATTNVQIVTGVKSPTPTKVIVVDIDGAEGLEAWNRITAHHGYVTNKGWISITGSGGRHHWFLLPDGTEQCPSGIIYGLYDTFGKAGRGEWCKHKEVRILADNALVVAPPSVHVDTGKRYEFLEPSPKVYRLPEPAPAWLLAMPRLTAPRLAEPPPPRSAPAHNRTSDRYYTREEVLDAVGSEKFDIARQWGLVAAVTGPNPSGWCSCFVPGREDPRYSRPSGSFHYSEGLLQDRLDLTTISFFDLGVVLGQYGTWQECRDDLGDRYIGKRPAYKYAY